MPAPLITLTTDLGSRDYYVPSVKGFLISNIPAANIVDITHEVEPFNIAEASFIVKGCYRDFPKDTLHIVSVDADNDIRQRFILVKSPEQYFLTHDNGFISLVLDEEQVLEIVELPYEIDDLVFPLKNILAPAAARFMKGMQMSEAGTPGSGYLRKAHLHPVVDEHFIRGGVVYIDNLGNAITNIHREHLERYGKGRKFQIYISRTEYFTGISRHYNEVPEGEKLCLMSTNGFLEIAINKGNGSGLLGLKIGHTVLVEFL